ncbi:MULTISPECIES: NAD-dependent epimerase/dehydratase family protein [unclassified Streptomyces]|uniref:NAD-dependent epimerase/dehydratase family protein n=1 Tax=unclassified Streptomyces TaxID=2593676 RepID=UPI0007C44F8F|nr:MULTISPECIES: NAD-dependent epimerase/dehydratase family protein [unclassified Streptomyces]MYT32509.1 NAD-dependent epimerase/dehydratase family protein [Streptomyces sp. SID8354]
MPGHASRAERITIRRAVVIGAGGFIGRKLSAVLNQSGIDTACFTRKAGFISPVGLAYCLLTADVVFYLASSINPLLGEQHPERAQADHRLFAELLRRLAQMPDPPAVMLTSSGGTVYDPDVRPPFSEVSSTRATSSYGAAKLALEEELSAYSDTIPGIILRLSNVYGPGQRATAGQGVLAHWLRSLQEGRPLRIIGDSACTRDYVYIDDVVDCMHRLLHADRSELLAAWGNPLVLNVGSGRSTSLAELADVVRTVVDRPLTFEHLPSRGLDRAHVRLDVRRARDAIGWQARTSLTDGVRAAWRAAVPAPAGHSS